MEELSPKSNKNGADQQSSSSDVSVRITDEGERISIVIPDEPSFNESVVHEWLGAMKHPEYDKSKIRHRRRPIGKVPVTWQRNEGNRRYFDPSVVSLGPYHHGKPELQLVENIKPRILQMFVQGSGKEIDDFRNKVLEVVDDARSCYIEGSTNAYDVNAFSEMMLLDGCFILCLIHIPSKPEVLNIIDDLGRSTWSKLATDMFLLENQVPFRVIQVLMSLKFKENEGNELINSYLDEFLFGERQLQNKLKLTASEDEKQPLHLLEACRMKFLSECHTDSQLFRTPRSLPRRYLWYLCGGYRKRSHGYTGVKRFLHSFRSATELKAKGIHFRPSKTSSLKDFQFKSFCFYGQLELPTFILSPYTRVIILNLIAYEMSPKNPNDHGVTTYIKFMRSLIDQPNDVKELRSKHILFNNFGSDEEVVKMYEELNSYGVGEYSLYSNVRDSIQEHCNSKMRTWMAELMYKYFSNPWTLIAFLAATSLVALSFVQTYFTIFPRQGK